MAERHEHWIDELSDYMDGDLVDEDRAALEAHLAECGDCRDALADLRELVAAARELGVNHIARHAICFLVFDPDASLNICLDFN